MKQQPSDDLLSRIHRQLYTAVVGDILDEEGYTHQFVPPQIRPLEDQMRVVGRAMPVLEADCFSTKVEYRDRDQPFGVMLEALDDLREDEVYICTGASETYALWGELMATRAENVGAVGAVVDGYSRDTRGLLNREFPTFSRGPYAQDQKERGRVIDYRCPIEFQNGVTVKPGDIVFGDIDGVVIIPRDIEEKIVERALEKASSENTVQKKLEEGMTARDAFDEYGVL